MTSQTKIIPEGHKWCCYHQMPEPICQFGKKGDGLQSACRKGMSLYLTDRYKQDEAFRVKISEIGKQYKKTEAGKQTRKRTLKKRKQKINETALKRHHERYSTDPGYRLRFSLRASLKKAAKRDGKKRGYLFSERKQASAVRDLGCSVPELIVYIESRFVGHMTWKNWGTLWHLDHIKPLAGFDLSNREQFLRACHYTNLQPLLIEDHKKKTVQDIRSLALAA